MRRHSQADKSKLLSLDEGALKAEREAETGFFGESGNQLFRLGNFFSVGDGVLSAASASRRQRGRRVGSRSASRRQGRCRVGSRSAGRRFSRSRLRNFSDQKFHPSATLVSTFGAEYRHRRRRRFFSLLTATRQKPANAGRNRSRCRLKPAVSGRNRLTPAETGSCRQKTFDAGRNRSLCRLKPAVAGRGRRGN